MSVAIEAVGRVFTQDGVEGAPGLVTADVVDFTTLLVTVGFDATRVEATAALVTENPSSAELCGSAFQGGRTRVG
jgi:hypothetical protein